MENSTRQVGALTSIWSMGPSVAFAVEAPENVKLRNNDETSMRGRRNDSTLDGESNALGIASKTEIVDDR